MTGDACRDEGRPNGVNHASGGSNKGLSKKNCQMSRDWKRRNGAKLSRTKKPHRGHTRFWCALNTMAPLRGRSAKVRIKQRLSLQKDTCQGKQSVRDTTESTSVRVATFSQRSISGATLRIALGGDTCPV